jgi:hypothetical protein
VLAIGKFPLLVRREGHSEAIGDARAQLGAGVEREYQHEWRLAASAAKNDPYSYIYR